MATWYNENDTKAAAWWLRDEPKKQNHSLNGKLNGIAGTLVIGRRGTVRVCLRPAWNGDETILTRRER